MRMPASAILIIAHDSKSCSARSGVRFPPRHQISGRSWPCLSPAGSWRTSAISLRSVRNSEIRPAFPSGERVDFRAAIEKGSIAQPGSFLPISTGNVPLHARTFLWRGKMHSFRRAARQIRQELGMTRARVYPRRSQVCRWIARLCVLASADSRAYRFEAASRPQGDAGAK
jgi:hypothetical protein